jgi:hypothetical protein
MKKLNISEIDITQSRKPYHKPQLMRVALRPEEAVLGACKTATGGSGTGGTCSLVSCVNQAS